MATAALTRAATQHEQSALRAASTLFTSFIRNEVAPAVGGALAQWNALGPAVQAQLPESIRQRNARLQLDADRWQQLVRGLQSGEYELAAWTPEGGELRLGVVSAGSLGFWPVVITVVAIGAVLGATWKVLDAWDDVGRLKAEAEATRAATAKSVQDTIAQVSKTDPNAATALANVLTRAQQAANAVGSSWAQGAAATYAKSATAAILVGVGLWWLLKPRGRRA